MTLGIGIAPVNPLGISYLDDAADPHRAPVYVGELTSYRRKGVIQKSVLQTRTPGELGLFALCTKDQNVTTYSARKK